MGKATQTYHRRKEAGLCVKCGAPAAPKLVGPGLGIYCSLHKDAKLKREEKRVARKRSVMQTLHEQWLARQRKCRRSS